jgi:hypothetical protein
MNEASRPIHIWKIDNVYGTIDWNDRSSCPSGRWAGSRLWRGVGGLLLESVLCDSYRTLLHAYGKRTSRTASRFFGSGLRSSLCVVLTGAWPASCWVTLMSAPASSRSPMWVLRMSWGENRATPAWRARLRQMRNTTWSEIRRTWVPFGASPQPAPPGAPPIHRHIAKKGRWKYCPRWLASPVAAYPYRGTSGAWLKRPVKAWTVKTPSATRPQARPMTTPRSTMPRQGCGR